jgi:hypothetical protein
VPVVHERATGVLVLLSTYLMSEKPIIIDRALRFDDIFVLVPLLHLPVFSGASVFKYGRPVGLIDPLDMFPEIYELSHTMSDAVANVRQSISDALG